MKNVSYPAEASHINLLDNVETGDDRTCFIPDSLVTCSKPDQHAAVCAVEHRYVTRARV